MVAVELGDVLNTTDAGVLIGRTQTAVRGAIHDGTLAATNIGGRWYVDRQVLLDWHRRSRQLHRGGTPSWEAVAELLAQYGPATAEELAQLRKLHVGNVRKHLAILSQQGRVHRLPDGQWSLTASEHQGAA